jgi:hypothetical protein
LAVDTLHPACRSGRRRHARRSIHSRRGVAADGITPEQAVDEAIARIKQNLAE